MKADATVTVALYYRFFLFLFSPTASAQLGTMIDGRGATVK